MDTEGLPPELDDFQPRLERAVARDAARSSRRRRLATRGALAATAVVATLVVGLSGVVGHYGAARDNPLKVDSAVALDKAAGALQNQADAILHMRLIGTETAINGSVITSWHEDSWQLTTASGAQATDFRLIEESPADWVPHRETGVVDGHQAVYDPASGASGTIYVGAKQPSRAFSQSEDLRQRVLQLVQSGTAKVAGHVSVDGRDALKIFSHLEGGDEVYLVDATTYDPIEYQTWIGNEDGGPSTFERCRFVAFEWLPLTSANEALVSLTAQHPGATVDSDRAHWVAAMVRSSSGQDYGYGKE